MKKLIILMLVLAFSTSLFAQKSNQNAVPASVKSNFEKQFPNIKTAKWNSENGNYEASFKENKIDHSATFDVNGKLLETEIGIKIKELPKIVLNYIKENYKGMRIKDAAKITSSDGKVTFEAGIKGKDLLFDSNGKFIKEVKE